MGYVYEGSDSEDSDTYITSGRAFGLPEHQLPPEVKPSQNRSKGKSLPGPSKLQIDPYHVGGRVHNDGFDFSSLSQGQIAPEDELFVSFQLVKQYPYMFIGKGNQQKVVNSHFENGELCNRVWDFFYIYRPNEKTSSPITLVPASQFKHFLTVINQDLGTNLTIPSGNKAFSVMFNNNGTPRPRYLGRTQTQAKATTLLSEIPPRYYIPSFEAKLNSPSQAAIEAFEEKINLITRVQQSRKKAKSAEHHKNQVAQRKGWGDSIKRVQRYLGVRQQSQRWNAFENLALADSHKAGKAGGGTYASKYDPERTAPFDQEKDVVFVCVDIESYERAHAIITEIGIAILDTRDVAKVIPGEDGSGYRNIIRARHFRISENSSYRNTEFVQDCPDKFEYGTSEWISIKNAPAVIASCFKYPYSDFSAPTIPKGEEAPKRNIILVGHDLQSDVEYMSKIGYNVHNLSNLIDHVDTKHMWQYVAREISPRSLGAILAELKLVGWYPHNAGNDAVYTLHAMLGTAIKHLQDRANRSEWKKEIQVQSDRRITDAVEQARAAAQQREQGWSSCDEGLDGGSPVKLQRKGDAATATPADLTDIPRAVVPQVEKPNYYGGPKYHAMKSTPNWDFNNKTAEHVNDAYRAPAVPVVNSGACGKKPDKTVGGHATVKNGMGDWSSGGKEAWNVDTHVEKVEGVIEKANPKGGNPSLKVEAKVFIPKSSTSSKSVSDGGWGLTEEEKRNLRDDIDWTDSNIEELLRPKSPKSPKAAMAPKVSSWGIKCKRGDTYGW